jgi:hypothetical protein
VLRDPKSPAFQPPEVSKLLTFYVTLASWDSEFPSTSPQLYREGVGDNGELGLVYELRVVTSIKIQPPDPLTPG